MPNSLTCVRPLARGCEPWRPAAVLVRACVRVPGASSGPGPAALHTRAAVCALCLFPQQSAARAPRGRRGLPATAPLPSGHTASPRLHTARKCPSDSLSVACHRALRPRLTFCRSPTQKNPSPLRPSALPAELLLLPPRSAPPAPPRVPAHVLLQHRRAPLLRHTRRAGHRGRAQRHPFSERPSSAGTLQHVS